MVFWKHEEPNIDEITNRITNLEYRIEAEEIRRRELIEMIRKELARIDEKISKLERKIFAEEMKKAIEVCDKIINEVLGEEATEEAKGKCINTIMELITQNTETNQNKSKKASKHF